MWLFHSWWFELAFWWYFSPWLFGLLPQYVWCQRFSRDNNNLQVFWSPSWKTLGVHAVGSVLGPILIFGYCIGIIRARFDFEIATQEFCGRDLYPTNPNKADRPIFPSWRLGTRPITVAAIDAEENVTFRHYLLESYCWGEEIHGIRAFMLDCGARKIDQSDFGTLWQRHVGRNNSIDLAIVEVQNSTPEVDGSHKTYILRVPPHMRTAREAVAWTFDMPEKEYAPLVET